MSEGPGNNLGCAPLEEIAEADMLSEDPNDTFAIGWGAFQIKYWDFSAEEMPNEAYEDYMNLEEVYMACNPPNIANGERIKMMRNFMQRYAEAQQDQ